MASKEEQFRKRLMATFRVEAEEHIQGIIGGMGAVDSSLEDGVAPTAAMIEPIYRQFHSLKGASQAIGFDHVGQNCQAAESILSVWKSTPANANRRDIAKIVKLALNASHELNISIPMLEEEAASIISSALSAPVAPAPATPPATPQAPATATTATATPTATGSAPREGMPVPTDPAALAAAQASAAAAFAAGQRSARAATQAKNAASPTNDSSPSTSNQAGITAMPGSTQNGNTPASLVAGGAGSPTGFPYSASSDPSFPEGLNEQHTDNSAGQPAAGSDAVAHTTSPSTPDIASLIASNNNDNANGEAGTPLRAAKKSATGGSATRTAPNAFLNSLTAAPRPGSETIRIASDKLDSLLRRGEQLVLARLNSRVRWTESVELLSSISTLRKKWEEQVQAGDVSHVTENDCEELRHFTGTLQRHVRNLAADHHELNTQLRALLDEVKSARLAPVRPLLEELEMAARRIARQLSKKVRIQCSGGELELDRSIMEALKDPLIHLVRNALDHGLEQSDERRRAGKQPEGKLIMSVSSHGTGLMEFRISDDGRGIQTDEVLEAARRQGLIADGVDIDSLDLIFSSGVSTRSEVSELSGRGLGMAIVREKVEALKGSVRVQTKIGQGTTFILAMPTSLATFDGLLVKERDRYLVFPINGVEAVTRFNNTDIRSVEGSQVVNFRGSLAPVSRLGQVLNLPAIPGHTDVEPLQAVIVSAGGRKAAFLVDEIFGAHEVLSRDLGPQLKKVRYIIGACMIDYKQVVPVLNVADLLTRIRGTTKVSSTPLDTHIPNLLVVDDSITTRTLMRGLLESANYQVKVAADGTQAWDLLQQEEFDLIVSDVDMPGITGFDLTVKVRSSARLRNIPLILVTGQERPEDRQRGLQLGASSYILKSRFDEGVLLEAVERLVGEAPLSAKSSGS